MRWRGGILSLPELETEVVECSEEGSDKTNSPQPEVEAAFLAAEVLVLLDLILQTYTKRKGEILPISSAVGLARTRESEVKIDVGMLEKV